MFRFKRQGDETTFWQAMLRPNAPALFSAFRDMQLSFADAKALQKELNDLLEKYEAKVNLEKPHYRVVVGLAETKKSFEK